MATNFKLEIVSVSGPVFSGEVDVLVAPGVGGQLAILAHHAPLMTGLTAGEMLVKKGGEEEVVAISGGFLEVLADKVVVLADAAERGEDIDIQRAEAAKKRAEEQLKAGVPEKEHALAEAALRRSLARLRVAEAQRRRGRRTGPGLPGGGNKA